MEPIDRRMLLGAAGIAGVAAMTKLAGAGPLNPPPGPVSPTGRTLDEIYGRIARTDVGVAEPRIPVQSLPGSATALHVITEPGSYYLTGNIQGVAGKNGVRIEASGVSLDLAGFQMLGGGGLAAILAVDGTRGVQIQNGVIQGWTEKAIRARHCRDGRLDRLIVMNCNAMNSGDPYAVRCGDSWNVERVAIAECPQWGIAIESGVYRDCLARENGGQGLAIVRGTMSDCVAIGNSDAGLWLGEACVVERSTAQFNQFGIVCGFAGLVQCNTVYGNQIGIVATGRRSRIVGNLSFVNATGIEIRDAGSTVQDNCCAENSGSGLLVMGTRHYITGNRATLNGSDYSIPAGNSHGPIVNVAGVGDISSVPGANHPWANFIY